MKERNRGGHTANILVYINKKDCSSGRGDVFVKMTPDTTEDNTIYGDRSNVFTTRVSCFYRKTLHR